LLTTHAPFHRDSGQKLAGKRFESATVRGADTAKPALVVGFCFLEQTKNVYLIKEKGAPYY
jgi:hypothetical protein